MVRWRGSSRSPCPDNSSAGWQTELNAQLYREAEIVSLLHARDLLGAGFRAALPGLVLGDGVAAKAGRRHHRPDPGDWRSISPRSGMPSMARSGRPPCCRRKRRSEDPFVMALRRIEFESSRLIQAQILLLKSDDLMPFRDAVNSAVETRHLQVRKLWTELLEGIGMRRRRRRRDESPRSLTAAISMQIKTRQSPATSLTAMLDLRRSDRSPVMKAVSVEEAVAMIPNGASIMVGGFMGVGTPERLLDELVRQKKSGLSLISNDAAIARQGRRQTVRCSAGVAHDRTHIGLNPKAQQQMLGEADRHRPDSAGHVRRADPRRRLRPRRRADADRRRHDSSRKASRRSRSTARRICWRRRCAPTSR